MAASVVCISTFFQELDGVCHYNEVVIEQALNAVVLANWLGGVQ